VRFSIPVQTSSEAHPASYTMGYWVIPSGKGPGHDANHPTPPSGKVKGRIQLYLYPTSVPSWQVTG